MIRFVFILFVALFAGQAAEAAAQNPSETATVSEDLSGLSNEQIRTRLLDACVIRQSETAKGPDDGFATRCGCYAGRVTKGMSEAEMEHLRRTGSFNPSAQGKAQAALQQCKVRQ